ncbi:hypothetical protein [Archangium gephyra]|nr:hypothetical protein [Archangium gephyra]
MLLVVNVLLGWDSEANGKAGAEATGEVWTSEHRDIYAAALAADGITDTQGMLTLFAGGTTGTRATVTDWAAVVQRVERPYSPAMFADLPDFSFSVANWLDGNERCPLTGWSTDSCYDADSFFFTGLTGWLVAGLNSSHFLPQARSAWSVYHTLALDTAARCKELDTAFAGLEGSDDVRATLVKRCELEALMFEGVAQHYQQDAWSSGHMWQRWGSADIQDWVGQPIDFARSLLVGSLAGFVHGTESRPLCAPAPEVLFSTGDSSMLVAGMGDMHLGELAGSSPVQAGLLNTCVMGSLDEVIAALPGRLGGVSGGRTHPGASCFNQRVTNGALRASMMVADQWKSAIALRYFARYKIDWSGIDLASVTEAERDELSSRARLDMVRWANAVSAARFSPANPDTGTNLADGKLLHDDGSSSELTMLGMRPNGAYESRIRSLATYDPSVAAVMGRQDVLGEQASAAKRLRYGLYEAYPDYWCAQDLAGEIQRAAERCRDPHLPGDTRTAHCQVCAGLGTFNRREGYGPDQPGEVDAVCDAFTDTFSARRLYLPPGLAPGALTSAKKVEAWCRAGCATRLSMVTVNAADASVNGDAVLTDYFNMLQAKLIAWNSRSSYYYSIG